MFDQRYRKLAGVLVNYSAGVKAGDFVLITATNTGLPMLSEVYREVIRVGANPRINFKSDECTEILLTSGSDQQLGFEDPVRQFEVESIDVAIALWAEDNTKSLSRIDPARQAKVSQARKKYMDTFMKRAGDGQLRWVGTQVPCQASAQDAEMSLATYEDFVFRAGLLHLDDPYIRRTVCVNRYTLVGGRKSA